MEGGETVAGQIEGCETVAREMEVNGCELEKVMRSADVVNDRCLHVLS